MKQKGNTQVVLIFIVLFLIFLIVFAYNKSKNNSNSVAVPVNTTDFSNTNPGSLPTANPLTPQANSDPTDVPLPVAAKPVIYLYPTNTLNVKVSLKFNGQITDSYPLYNQNYGGWNVKAEPGGLLTNNEDGKQYQYLFWEGKISPKLTVDLSQGFVVSGPDTAVFLQNTLSEMGLISHEYNEFIVYWLPRMQHNKYNLITFVGKEYTDNANLEISPKPDSILRVFMAYKQLDTPIEIKPQTFPKFKRNGFTVVGWGGTEL